jgi:hypothetical protein
MLYSLAATVAVIFAALGGWVAVDHVARRSRQRTPDDCAHFEPGADPCGHCLMSDGCAGRDGRTG